ncbi:capsid and scaffold protein [Staphylococcus phage vB_SauM_VL10]|nr:capsid and scaffold protein [Staphylococcus phage vB_SauM_VL10]
MTFNYTPLTESQRLKDMYPKVNEMGKYLKEEVNLSDLKTVSYPDLNNVLNFIQDSGDYFVTQARNTPQGVSNTGFLHLDKKGSTYYKLYYAPSNTNKLFVKTYYNGTVYDWVSFKLDEGTLYDSGNTINVKDLTESTTQFATLINPPKSNLNTGWINYKESKNGTSALAEFNPINSTSTFKMIRKLPNQDQRQNLLRDSLFTLPMTDVSNIRTDYIDNNTAFWGFTDNASISPVKYTGENTVQLDDSSETFPAVISKRFRLGDELYVGDTITMSVYLKVNDPNLLNGNFPYFEIAGYDNVYQTNNPYTGGRREVNYYELSTEWKKFSFTFTLQYYNQEYSRDRVNYISALLRFNCSNSRNNGAIVYYALPKLEKSSVVTPFITHMYDKRKYDEIWSNWIETTSKDELQTHSVVDANNNDYYKYVWNYQTANGKSLQQLAMTVPQGFYTFYCEGTISGTPKSKTIQGTIQVSYRDNNIQSSNKIIQMDFNDLKGKKYSMSYNKYDTGWQTTKIQMNSYSLWEGELDLALDGAITLTDSLDNYDFIDVIYWTKSAGHSTTRRFPANTDNITIRDFNMVNNNNSASMDFFEGYCDVTDKKIVTPRMSKTNSIDGNRNTISVGQFNQRGNIQILRIVGLTQY